MFWKKSEALFTGKMQESYVLVGEKGRFNTQTKVIEVFDGVKIDSSDGYHLRTRSLKYQAEQREFTTSDPVEMDGPDLEVDGVGMVVELNQQRLKILGGVTTHPSLRWRSRNLPNRPCEMGSRLWFLSLAFWSSFGSCPVSSAEQKEALAPGKTAERVDQSGSDQPLRITSQQLEADNKNSTHHLHRQCRGQTRGNDHLRGCGPGLLREERRGK